MARPGTGGGSSSGGGFSGSRSGGSSSSGRSSGGSSSSSSSGRSSSSGSSSGRSSSSSSSSGRSSSSSSSSSGSFSSRSSSDRGRSSSRSSSSDDSSFFGGSSSSPKKYTTSSSSSGSTRSSGGRTVSRESVSYNQNRQYPYGAPPEMRGKRGGYGHHYDHHYYRPSLFRRMFYRRGYGDYYYQNVSFAKTGCLIFFILPFLAAMVIGFVLAVTGFNGGTNHTSPTQIIKTATSNSDNANLTAKPLRTPLSPAKVAETDYYQDDLGWIEEPETLLAGLKEFFSHTGVQPYLRLAAPVSATNTNDECNAFAEKLYDELFQDEGHFLLAYIENLDPDEVGYLAYVCGSDAVTVMDDPAVDILYQYIDKYWFDEANTTEEVFSNAFRDTAREIMIQSLEPGNWSNSSYGWQFTDDNGEILRNVWAEIDETLYYFTPDGYMATGWIEYDNKYYYAHESGELAVGWLEEDDQWYYFDENGVSLSDTTTPDGYYLNENGVWVP